MEDLLFSENDFLHPRDQNGISPASSDTGPSESPYFQQKERNSRLQVEPLPLSSSTSLSLVQKTKPKKIQHVKESYKMVNINKSKADNTSQFTNRDYDPHYQEEKAVTPIKRRKLVANPSPPSIISRISVLKQSNGHHENPRNLNRAQRTNGNESDHSNDSIKRLLSECKEAPQPENTKTNNNNSASDYIWRPSLSSPSNISPTQRVYSSPENYLPSRYNESTSSYRSSYTDRLLSVDHKLYQIDDYNSDELSPLKTLYEEEDNGIKNFWRNQHKRRL